jgi:hypothetical protein
MTIMQAVKSAQSALAALGLVEGVLRMTQQQEQKTQEPGGAPGKRTVFEEIELEGRQLVDRVRELIAEGNVRRLIIKDQEGKYLLEIPLTVGVVAGGVFALTAPVWAALGALAALVAKVKIEVVREESGGDE